MITVADLARALDAEAVGETTLRIAGVAEPSVAGPDQVALAMQPEFAAGLAEGRAGAAILWQGADWQALGLKAAIFAPRPRYVLAGVTRVFDHPLDLAPGIHASAIIDPAAEIGPGCSIGPFVVIGARARIGAGVRIFPHVTVGADAEIGPDALLHAGVRICARVSIGARFIAQPNAVIGGDGFSFVTPTPGHVEEARTTGAVTAARQDEYVRINSLGSVRLGDDVEVGSNSCIDRGTVADTWVGDGTKIDNQVQIGHNVRIGRTCLICGHVGIAGSVDVGDRVVLAGKVGIADHVKIGSNVVVAGNSGVASNIPDNRIMMGTPAVRMDLNVEMYKALRRLPRLMARLEAAQKPVSNPDASD